MSRFFTDGSCKHPQSPWHRRAAFSIVLSTSSTDTQRAIDVDFFRTKGTIPPTFQTFAVAECKGVQTIPRAELQAVAFVATLGVSATIFTDSAYVIDTFSTLASVTHVRQLAIMANSDILLPLWRTGAWKRLEVRKVKAHELNIERDDIDTTWQKIANEAADLAAKEALLHFSRILPINDDYLHFTESTKRLPEQFSLRAKQQAERAKPYDLQRQQKKLPEGALNFEPQLQTLNNWAPDFWHPVRSVADIYRNLNYVLGRHHTGTLCLS